MQGSRLIGQPRYDIVIARSLFESVRTDVRVAEGVSSRTPGIGERMEPRNAYLVDTHCHLNDPSFRGSIAEVIERARAAGVRAFVVPAYDRASLEPTAQLALSLPGVVFPAFGIHPWFARPDINYGEIRSFLTGTAATAVGEIGLDFAPDCPSAAVQVESLRSQLDLAVELDLPACIHCRKAYDQLYETLAPYRGKLRGVLHSFSGTRDQMLRFIDLGLFISFSGALTRRTARRYHRNAQEVAAQRFLVETDAPSIATESTPAPQVEPLHTVEVAVKLSELRKISYEEVCLQATENARTLFRVDFGGNAG